MNQWLEIFKHLLPQAKAWRIIVDKQLRQFFDGLTGLPDDIRIFFANIFLDIFPATTTALGDWFAQFNLTLTGVDATDRQTLSAAWILNEYQSPRQIQDTLQAAGFDIYIHEWWQQPVVGSPEPHNPFTLLGSLVEAVVAQCGESFMECGESQAVAGQLALVPNKVSLVALDDNDVQLDDPVALLDNFIQPTGLILVNKTDILEPNTIPPDADKWPFFLYFGAEIFPNHADIPLARKTEFETLLLRINPTEQWLGLLVNYV